MTDLEIRYPKNIDLLPLTTRVSIDIDQNINALREAILNIEKVLGLEINTGLFTPNQLNTSLADRLNRIERGIAERNLVFRELNVSDSLQVLLDSENSPSVKVGSGLLGQLAPVTILGPLTILAPAVAKPETLVQTALKVDVTSFNPNFSSSSLFKGKSNSEEPLLTIQDTNTNPSSTSYALKIQGNVKITGKLEADYAIDHAKLLNTDSIPTSSTRGVVKHVTSGDYHTHKKGKYNSDLQKWIVDSSVNDLDYGIINHKDLEGINTLPTQGSEFTPQEGVAYHVTGGDLHDHKAGRGAQIDHNDLSNINPRFSNHVTGGDSHAHTSAGDGGSISHIDLLDVTTTGTDALHVTRGDLHDHSPDSGVAQISHTSLLDITTTGSDALHVSGGNSHTHSSLGDGGQIDHTTLSNTGSLTHDEIDAKIESFRAIKAGSATFTTSSPTSVTVQHNLGTDQFNVLWSPTGLNIAPSSTVQDIGMIYVSSKTSQTFTLERVGGSAVGPAIKAQGSTSITGNNNDLLFIARNPGVAGNSIAIKYEANESISTNPFVVATLTSITVYFKSSSKPTATTTRLAILSDTTAKSIVDVQNNTGNDGTGTIDAYGPFYLSGGADTTGFTGLELDWVVVAKN